ncbi:MAG: hypothetical protein IIY31_01355 [Desulfovibrio sp.]|nr:hypothetical protein [Desulfovibrio sp.]
MKLNEGQFKALQPYEAFMRTAVEGRWARNPGRRALEIMAQIYKEVAHLRLFTMDYNCSTCIVNLLSDLGRPYFADKAEREAQKAEKKTKKVSTTKKAKAPAQPVEVKTETEPKTEDSAKSAE